MTNHYEALGVDKTATSHDIKKAYKKKASTTHPDKGGDTAKFQEINTAYQILSDDQKRAEYDQELEYGPRHSGFGGGRSRQMNEDDIADLLRKQFGFSFNFGGNGAGGDPFSQFKQQHQNKKPTNRDVRISMELDLVDNLKEQTKTINITLPGNEKENLEIKIPRGVTNGTTVRYPGLGDHSVKDAPRADLFVQFHFRPHPNFEQYGIDLVTQITVNCLEAIVGCEKEIRGLDGTVLKLTIPPGTQYGTKFGLSNQGLYSTNEPGRGRLIAIADVHVLQHLTDAELEKIKEIVNANVVQP
jgi:curved DNA-binding protein